MQPSFRNEMFFLSNMYPCEIKLKVIGQRGYTFPSSENAFQAMKYTEPDIIEKFQTISPFEAKQEGKKRKGFRKNWDVIKLNIMQQIVHAKFTQHPDLMDKLLKCDLPLIEENTWNDTYWGTYYGKGQNHLGAILTSEAIKEMINRLTKQYNYKKLPDNISLNVRQIYNENLPDFFRFEKNNKYSLSDVRGNKIANKWNRIVIGDYGAFVEINDEDIIRDNIEIMPGEEYRVYDDKYKDSVKYQWYTVKGQPFPKLYYQQREVTYADYKAGKWYISPFDCLEGLSITCKNNRDFDKTIKVYADNRVLDRLNNTSSEYVNIPSGCVIYDTETTGFNQDDEILQITIYDGDGMELISTYLQPYNKLNWDEAQKVNHITPEMVRDAPYPHEIAPLVRDIFNSANTIIGHNVSFDNRMVKNNLGINVPVSKVYDTLRMFKKQYPNREHYKLIDAVEVYCPEIMDEFTKNAHDAKMDTYATMKVYLAQKEHDKNRLLKAENELEDLSK